MELAQGAQLLGVGGILVPAIGWLLLKPAPSQASHVAARFPWRRTIPLTCTAVLLGLRAALLGGILALRLPTWEAAASGLTMALYIVLLVGHCGGGLAHFSHWLGTALLALGGALLLLRTAGRRSAIRSALQLLLLRTASARRLWQLAGLYAGAATLHVWWCVLAALALRQGPQRPGSWLGDHFQIVR